MGCHGLEYEHGFIMMSHAKDGQTARETLMLQHWNNFKILRGKFDKSVNVSD